jgi:hypothetical protein
MSAKASVKIRLAFKSGDICAFFSSGTCKQRLTTDDGISGCIVGEAAHIYGEKPNSARYGPDMSDIERNSYDNLLYLCPNCHTKIDKLPSNYPGNALIALKSKHEDYINKRIQEDLVDISFAELEIAAKAIATGLYTVDSDLHLMPPQEKIKKNGLSLEIKSLIVGGLSRSSEVSSYLNKQSQLEPNFAQCLKNGFKIKYMHFKEKGLHGDDLFMGILNHVNACAKDMRIMAANLAIICYLFEICEIFEK